MIDKNTIVSNLQSAIDTMCHYKDWCTVMMRDAQPLALEGEKRRNEVYAKKLYELELCIIKDCYDGFDTALTATKMPINITSSNTDIEHFRASLSGYVDLYDKLHSVANNLVIANAKPFSEKIYCLCSDIWKECIIDIKRKLKQSKVLSENKATHHTLIFQQSWQGDGNTHDYFEGKN